MEKGDTKDPRRSLELLWGAKEKPSRGPKPSMSLERIVQCAIEVAVAEGVSELSMRRVASRLGVGPMSLYRYVESKDELIDLVLDAVVGPPPILESVTGGWRPKIEYWARRESEIFQRYPWALQLVPRHFLMGPNRIGWMESALSALRDSGLRGREMLDVVNVVDRYIRGMGLEFAVLAADSGIRPADWWPAHAPFLQGGARATKFPTVIEVFEAPPTEPPNGLEFGLQRILDGIEAMLEQRAKPAIIEGAPTH